MRLVCPNCSAQYEVDAAVIPEEGRDVLCSNCGHAWFQLSERQLAAESADEQDERSAEQAATAEPAPAVAVAPPEEPRHVAVSQADRAAEAAAATAAATRMAAEEAVAAAAVADLLPAEDTAMAAPAPIPQPDLRDEEGTDEAAQAPLPPRRALDDDMLSVLREEAAREAEARRAEGSAIEIQPELGLPEVEPPHPTIEDVGAATVRALRRRDEALAEAEDDEPEVPQPVNRKALLPDIEEINSTLTASSERRDLPAHLDDIDRRRNRSGFRAGFSISLLIALALLLLYISAPRLSHSLPALAPALDRYVASVDAGRIWLDARLRNPEAASTN